MGGSNQLLTHLQQVGVDVSGIEKMPQHSTGIAQISVDQEGENSIIVAPGANQWITPEIYESMKMLSNKRSC